MHWTSVPIYTAEKVPLSDLDDDEQMYTEIQQSLYPTASPPGKTFGCNGVAVGDGVMGSARKLMGAPSAALRSVLTIATASNNYVPSNKSPMERVPGDVLLEIAAYLSSSTQILHLCLTVRVCFPINRTMGFMCD